MQTNRTKAALREGRAVVGPIIGEARSVGTVKLMAQAGFDFLFFDMEHAMFDWETILTLVQTSLLCDITPIVRVTDLAYPFVARALDSGAQGIIIPRVETREQVEAAVSYAKYPPLGRRGAGGEARYAYARLDPKTAVERANAETMVVVQVESRAGVEAIDEIASVPGLDVVLIGPQDLSISLGIPGQSSDPDFIAAVKRVIEACQRHGIAAGQVEREASALQRWYDLGARFLCCNTDANMLFQAAKRDVSTVRSFTGSAS
ncbi:MAG TPA: aldolase/citrate lyase family protein [Thermomicrobiales bacterium]